MLTFISTLIDLLQIIFHIYIFTIYLPYAYNTYQVGQEEEEWRGPATVDGEGDMDKSQISSLQSKDCERLITTK